jgi:acetyl-CoA synthetase
MGETDINPDVVWRPDSAYVERAHLTHFMRQHGIASFEDLLLRARQDVGWFTDAVLRYLEIEFSQPYERAVDLSRGIAWPEWCVGGRMNIVHNCLDKWLRASLGDKTALVYEREEGDWGRLSYAELAHQVDQVANALRALGLSQGDAVGLYMPMTPELIVAMLAVAKIGAVILPLFSGYGAGAVASRLQDGEAKALFTSDGFFRRGALVDMKAIADRAVARAPSVEHVIVHQRAGNDVQMHPGRDHWWGDFLEGQLSLAEAADTAAEDLLMIIYTSGTTGRPKGAVHTHCGFPVKAAQDMAFGTDVHRGDLIYWMTDMGWMMGPWLVFGSLILGASMFIYDGAPDYPGPDRVWEMVERHGVNVLGLAPTFVRALRPSGEAPIRAHDLSSLRFFGSTGESWDPEAWTWLFEVAGKGRVPVINYSGGTEISGGILMGNPIRPLKPCAFSGPCPGIDADVFDEDGRPIRGQVGELVVKTPWIGMTRGFWRDPERYEQTYWSRWEGVWAHGDWAMVDDDGMWYILGRSDDTIKVAGKRIGPAEVESTLMAHPSVAEAAAVGVPDPLKGSALLCFCVLKPGTQPSAALESELKEAVISELGKPLAPKAIRFLPDLPKTRNAKIMRRMIRAAYLGEDPGDTSALVNPEVLEAVRGEGDAEA